MAIRGNRRGITLIEVILVIVVLAIIVPGLFLAINHGTLGSVHAEVMTTASLLAQEKMEEKISDKRKAGGYATVTPQSETPVAGFTNFNRITAICLWDPGTSACGGADLGYKLITVTVQYTQPLPSGFSDVVLQTLVTNY